MTFYCPSCRQRFETLLAYQEHVGRLGENRSIPLRSLTRNDRIGSEEP